MTARAAFGARVRFHMIKKFYLLSQEDLHLTVDDTDRVFQLFPELPPRHACAYWIGVSRRCAWDGSRDEVEGRR